MGSSSLSKSFQFLTVQQSGDFLDLLFAYGWITGELAWLSELPWLTSSGSHASSVLFA